MPPKLIAAPADIMSGRKRHAEDYPRATSHGSLHLYRQQQDQHGGQSALMLVVKPIVRECSHPLHPIGPNSAKVLTPNVSVMSILGSVADVEATAMGAAVFSKANSIDEATTETMKPEAAKADKTIAAVCGRDRRSKTTSVTKIVAAKPPRNALKDPSRDAKAAR